MAVKIGALFPDEAIPAKSKATSSVGALFQNSKPAGTTITEARDTRQGSPKPLFATTRDTEDVPASTPATPVSRVKPVFTADEPAARTKAPDVKTVFEAERKTGCYTKKQAFTDSFIAKFADLTEKKNKAANLALDLISTPANINTFADHLINLYKKYSNDAAELAYQIDKRKIGETLTGITDSIIAQTKKPSFSWFSAKKAEPLDLDAMEKTLRSLEPFLQHVMQEPTRVKESLRYAYDDLHFYSAILATLHMNHATFYPGKADIEKRLHHRFTLLSGCLRGVDSMMVIMDMKISNLQAWTQEIEKLLITTLPPLRVAQHVNR